MPSLTPARPSPSVTTLDFGDAMREVVRGHQVTRQEWDSADRVFLRGEVLHIQIAEDRPELNIAKGLHRFVISEGDLTATDWIVAPRS